MLRYFNSSFTHRKSGHQNDLSLTENTRDRSHDNAVCVCKCVCGLREPIPTVTMSAPAGCPSYNHTCYVSLFYCNTMTAATWEQPRISEFLYFTRTLSAPVLPTPSQLYYVVYGVCACVRVCVRESVRSGDKEPAVNCHVGAQGFICAYQGSISGRSVW